ncbi:MAG: hypothetical protein JNN07_00085 [Verrucomicrobiales bacterium]|nr:hypothetical protein [Verrucomicrobiales bacterium]
MHPLLFLAPVIAGLSGAAALAHQILWTRRLVDILGASEGTFARVVGMFFLGLAGGGWIASRWRDRGPSPWHRLAWAEMGVGILALPLALGAQFSHWISHQGGMGTVAKWMLPFLLILPPSLLMGLVTPLLIRALAHQPWFRPGQAIWLYSVNTLGGVAGIGFVMAYGLPRWGLTMTALGAVALNLFTAALCWSAQRWSASDSVSSISSHNETPPSASVVASVHPPPLLTLAFLSGFLVMAQEVLLQHQFAQVTINSFFSSATVLAFVLLGLVGGAWLIAPFARATAGNFRTSLWIVLAGSGAACLLEPFLFLQLRPNLAILPYELKPAAYFLAVAGMALITIVPLMVASGMLFPLLLRWALAENEDRRTSITGRLLAVNGLGGWIGAEAAERWVGPSLGIWGGIAALGGIYWVMGVFFTAKGSSASCPRWLPLAFRFGVILAVGGMTLVMRLPQLGQNRAERLVELRVGREGVVATVSLAPDDWRIVFNNSYTLGGSKAQYNQERQAHLPLLLHGEAKSVALLGLATGSTCAGVTLHPNVQAIDAAELSPLVIEFARKHFAPFNRNLFTDPRLRVLQEDARWLTAANPGRYDVVIGDLFLPWRTGEGRLFTVEHFQTVRTSLTTNGLFCQWLPLFQLTREQFEVILHTFRAVFPEAFLVRGDFYTELPIVGLVGGRSMKQLDWARIQSACERLRGNGAIQDPLVRHPEGVAMCLLGPPGPDPAVPLNTLGNAWLEWDAGRNILGLKNPWFVGIPSAEYVREVFRRGQAEIPERFRSAHDSGQFFLTLEVAAKLNLPALSGLKAQITDRLPPALAQDPAADWRHWPMRLKPHIP